MKKNASMVAGLILGLIYFVFGLNGFLNFLPIKPPPMPEAAMTYMNGLMATHYFFPVLKATETICGLLLLSGFAVPLALIILAPITLQIFLFHSILTPGLENIVLPLLIVILHIVSAMAFWNLYKPLFVKAKNS